MKHIVIDGWWGSGKSTLRGMLEGHPEIYASPIQDSIIGGFSSVNDVEKTLTSNDTEAFRKILASHTNYYRIEKYANWGYVLFQPSAAITHQLDFHFDFYGFDHELFRKIKYFEISSLNDFIEFHYVLFFKYWKDYQSSGTEKYFLSMEANQLKTIDFLLDSEIDFKFIYVDRETEGTISTRYSRKPIKGFVTTESYSSYTVDHFIKSGEVYRIIAKRKKLLELQQKHSERFLVVRLEETISNPEAAAKKIAEFLDISYNPILSKFTYLGKQFPGSELYLNKVNDNFNEIFDKNDLSLLRKEIVRCENGGGPPVTNGQFRRILGHTRSILSILLGRS